MNSYKRLKLGTTASGATWSPVWISYGYNNRTQMLRIPGPGRIEDRTIDGSCNPYLAAAAVLAAGPRRDRAARSTPASRTPRTSTRSPTTSSTARGLETLPANLLEATGELERDDVLRTALGRGRDEDYVDYYVRVKRDEWFRYHEQVTPWEVRGVPDALLVDMEEYLHMHDGQDRGANVLVSMANSAHVDFGHMCGIVGLFAKSPEIEERLGEHLAAMLAQMSDRGPDSAGVAVYRDPVAERLPAS